MPKQKIVPLCVLLSGLCAATYGQTVTKSDELRRAATEQAAKEKVLATTLQKLAKEKNWPLVLHTKNGGLAALTNVDDQGYPIYTTTYNNIVAAATTGTNKLWPGGATGLNLSGSSASVRGKLGVWDGGRARPTHVELTGRINNKENGSVAISDHTTHVSGTLIAAGVNPLAKGMAFGFQDLVVYDFNSNLSEMLTESTGGMLISNHSYGSISGWYQNTSQSNRWEFRGQFNATEDYKFGFYDTEAQTFDEIAFNAPYHLIVKSAGNNRNQNGPAVGANYWRYNSSGTMTDAGARPAGISNNDGYDIIPMSGTAKNILTVGAIDPLTSGYSSAQGVTISDFSSWGPTDDGRIKPDIVADGVELLSSTGSSDNSYGIFSGTSMASPAAAGSLILLQEYYSRLHPSTYMRSATLKALAIHTADEAGTSAGPDYIFGWGVLNVAKAANVITGANGGTEYQIVEDVLNGGATKTINVVASGKGALTATLVWTDPKGAVHAAQVDLDTRKLINDLDIRITKGATTYMPWILDPSVPDAAATTGDNTRDNVEKVEIADVVPGVSYTITISHKGTLTNGSQAYSLIVSGVGGTAYCAPASGANSGARVDSVSFGGIQKQNVAGCITYTNFTSITGAVEPNSTVPLYVKLASCVGGTTNKVVKAWMDLNNDGDFNDAGELLTTSAVINGDGPYTTNVTIPAGVSPGNYAVLRVAVVETSNAADVTACYAGNKGETQDYRIRFANPSNDVGIVDIVSPQGSGCASGSQYVTIRFKNLSTTAKANIVLSGTVKDGATTVATLSGTYVPSVAASGEVEYTFQTPFAAVAGKTYTVNVKAALVGDQNAANDEQTTNFVVNTQAAGPTAQAEVCGTSVILQATNPGSDIILWYETATATTPIASGATTTSTVITANKTYYVGRNDLANGKVGPANKSTLGAGGYSTLQNFYIKFNNQVPVTIESARLYIGAAGRIEFILANLGTVTGTSYTYFPIASKTLNVYPTTNGTDDPGAVFALNFAVTDPGDHIIICRPLDGASIYRNNGVTGSPYPFSIPNIFSITGNSNSDPSDANYYQRFYYWFYDMSIKLNGCASTRTSVVASTNTAPTITLNGNTFTSSVASGNQWYLNNAPINGANGQTYQATQNGAYKTVINSPLGCQSSSNEITYGVTGIPNIDPSEISLKVMPNPNNGQFTLDFTVSKKSDLNISIVNAIGQKVYTDRTPGFIGRYNQPVNAGKLASGVYLLQIQHDNKSYLKKLIVR
jgi:hypothetical protein